MAVRNPTQTRTLQARFAREARRRISRVANDTQGEVERFLTSNPYEYGISQEILRRFQIGIQDNIDRIVLNLNDPSPYYEAGIRTSVNKGNIVATTYIANLIRNLNTAVQDANISNTLRVSQLLAGRTFNLMEGLTGEMKNNLNESLSRGIEEGRGIKSIAAEVKRRLNLSRGRANRIARTEVVNARVTGYIERTRDVKVFDKVLKYVAITVLDNRRRQRHGAWDGRIFTYDQVRRAKGEPNCRCNWVAITSNDSRYNDTSLEVAESLIR